MKSMQQTSNTLSRRDALTVPTGLLLLSILLALLLSMQAEARKSDFSEAIDVSADRSEFDEKAGVQRLIGNVVITQGSMRINADEISIQLRDNRLSKILGLGSPIQFEQENEQSQLITGEAREIIYDAEAGTLTLVGNATLKQPRQQLQSERIVFDSVNQKVSAESGAKKRVSIRIQPPSSSGN